MDLLIGKTELNQSGTRNKMPTYTFKNKDTGEVFDKIMKIAEKPEYLKNNPNTPLADRFSRKSAKDIKRDKVVDKYNLKDTLL